MNEQPHLSATSRLGVAPHPALQAAPKPKEDVSSIAISSDSPVEGRIKLVVPGTVPEIVYKRQPVVTGKGACRVRSFHCRLNDDATRRLDEKINEWLDNHPEIEVKFAVTTVGEWGDKSHEPAMMINVWW
jgi:hypothetical protein